MKIHDISMPISSEMILYPGDPEVVVTPVSRISQGDDANVSILCMGSHTGTHVDPPRHFVDDGLAVDRIPLDAVVGRCLVCAIEDADVIGVEQLTKVAIPPDTKRILFKTRNSAFWNDPSFRSDFTYLDEDAARWLVDRGVRLVGIDYLSVDAFCSETHPAHMCLLQAGVVVAEGLDLRGVGVGTYNLVCLPLRIEGGDGGPARAILIEEDDA
jgi:arylformamidase